MVTQSHGDKESLRGFLYLLAYMHNDAAAAEISQRVFEETGDLQPTSRTWANAQEFAGMNNGYLSQYGISALVTGITVDAGKDTVLVQVSANLERLFPSVVPDVTVTENGFAEIRAFTH